MGYGAASVDDIAKRAGMSKKTLYQLFDTKESLFAAVIASRRAALKEMIEAECCGDTQSASNVLRKFLGQVARFVLARRQAALYRLVIAESQREPELARAFYREGPSKGHSALIQWLKLQHEQKALIVPDPACAAGMRRAPAVNRIIPRAICPAPRAASVDRRHMANLRFRSLRAPGATAIPSRRGARCDPDVPDDLSVLLDNHHGAVMDVGLTLDDVRRCPVERLG
jgi:AcrR family transcriptional regulator